MSEKNPWADQWFKAQQQFVDAWSDMAKSASGAGNTRHSDLWSQGMDLWRQSMSAQKQPDVEQAMQKCMDMGREYFAMAEQISKSLADGKQPVEAINEWMEQTKQALQQFSGMPGFDAANVSDFMKQWFDPTRSWQQMIAGMSPMNTSTFNMGEAIDPLGKILSSPGIGYFREPQEKQQKGIQLALDYQQANFKFNQAFLRVAIESIQGFQQRLMKLDAESAPGSLRQLYDLWVEVSEEHYAEFAMSDEYQALYGDMVNRLMVLKKHYAEIVDDTLRALDLPNTREVDTMQERLQQLRRENHALRREIGEIRAMLKRPAAKSAPPQQQAEAAPAKRAPAKKTAAKKATAKKAAVKKKASKPQSTAGA
jgi:class III poly(R)-hydroxyalkanoic acid synthase PhaE subunit